MLFKAEWKPLQDGAMQMPGPLGVSAGGHDPAPRSTEAAESSDSGFTE